MGWFDTLLYPLKWAVAWMMVTLHHAFAAIGLDSSSGLAWVLAIVGMTIVIRILLIPLFFKQIKAQRGIQIMQPELQALQKKYKGKKDPASRQRQQQEMMDLYKKHGTNPFSSCMPILLQMPVFFALFRVLASLPMIANGTYHYDRLGPLTASLAEEAQSATLLGARISDTFMQTSDPVAKVVTVVLIALMSITTFITTRQLTMKNMSAQALDNPMAKQQKMMMYLFPVIFAVTGVNFPIGVLIYWTTTNLWSMGQQFYTIQKYPAPGSEAEKAKIAKENKKRIAKGLPTIEEEEEKKRLEEKLKQAPGQRKQPVRKDRAGRGKTTREILQEAQSEAERAAAEEEAERRRQQQRAREQYNKRTRQRQAQKKKKKRKKRK
ncbi:MAG: membrane protein insertase YidC [Bowdeniella nasicola]|nr:membrane protein insertase YidC [Bowdeniella nasicola]